MNVSGLIRIFPKKISVLINREHREITIFETSISHKDDEGNYVDNYTIRVNFPLDVVTAEQRAKFKEEFAYVVDVKEGFLTTRSYNDKEGNKKVAVALYITKFELKEKKPIVKKPVKPQTSETPLAESTNLDDIL